MLTGLFLLSFGSPEPHEEKVNTIDIDNIVSKGLRSSSRFSECLLFCPDGRLRK
jgi:hypothetical protein